MAANEGERPIIVKKIKKGEHAHHGGAWKVAYADFVTAMMAFFLLLWLLNVTTDEQKKGVADYFSPASVSRSLSGAGGVMGGRTIIEDGGKISSFGLPTVIVGPSSEKSDQPDQPQYDQKYEDSVNRHRHPENRENVSLTRQKRSVAMGRPIRWAARSN